MAQEYIHLKFQNLGKEKQEILIAKLSELGAEGFEEGNGFLSAYIPGDHYEQPVIDSLIAAENVEVGHEVIEQKNWNEEWEKSFEPVIIDDFCAIRASFHAPVEGVEHEIIITPKMSFGTGHHATTYLVIKSMKNLDFKGRKVLDFGTGTGILGILAEKQGAQEIIAIDNDGWSITNAIENISVNGCTAILPKKAEIEEIQGQFDIILANINKHVLLANMALIGQHLKPGGVVLMSGILTGDRQDIETAALNFRIAVTEQKELKGWICVSLRKELN